MIDSIIVGITVLAAVLYLVVELCELNILWRKRHAPEPEPEYPPGIGDTWPEHRRAEASEEWERAFNERQP